VIDDESKKTLSKGLDILLSLQRSFQEGNKFDVWKEGPEKRREMFVRTLFAAISELSETGDEVNKWWKKGHKEPESLDKKRDKILEEMVDALHFYLSCLLILKASGKEVADSYLKKLGVNFDRQMDRKHGYIR
jgi:dimeric dUTPase (all-alpha-NTP-PPase superfamily)